MESGERLASPSSAPSSLHITSSTVSSAVYSPAPAPVLAKTPSLKCSLTPSPATLGSPLTTCGDLFRAAGDHHFNMSTVSSAFPIFNHPAFGLYTTSSGHSEFGGLGSLGMSAALAAHSQLGAFPEWWRAAEAQGRGAAAFFPHLLGLPPMFLPQLQQSHDPSPFQARTPSKNGRATAKGVNGAVNGSSVSTVSGGISTTATTFSTQGNTEKLKGTNNGSGKIRMSHQDMNQVKEKTKEKKLGKKLMEASSNSDSESGSSSDISSEGLNSSESDDLDDDDDDQSNDSDDSNSAKESVKRKMKGLTQSPADSKKKKPCAAEGEEARDSRTALLQKHPDEAFLHSLHYPLHPSPQPPALPQSMALVFQSSRTREEELKQHTSVIQATGRASIKPLALVTQPRREASSSPQPTRPFSLSSSPKSYPLSSSPKLNAVSSSPKHLSLCSSPKPLSSSPKPLSSSPKPLSLSTSSKPPSLSSSPKPPTLSPSHKPKSRTASPKLPTLSDSMKAGGRTFLDETLLHINNFKLKQEHFKQAFPLPLTHQDLFKSPKKMAASSSLSLPPPKLSPETLSSHTLPSPHTNNSNLFLATSFLGPHHNGVIHSTVQDAPLALITKPRSISQSRSTNNKTLLAATSPSFSMPVNLSTGTKEHSSGGLASTSPGLAHRAGKSKAQHKALHKGKDHQTHLVHSLVELFRGTESDILDSKDSDDSVEDDDDDDDDEEDSGDSLSESESNVESDSDGSEDNVKDRNETTTDAEAERTALKLTKGSSSLLNNTSSGLSASCSPLNLQVIKAAGGLPTPAIVTSSGALAYHSTPSSSSSTLCSTPPGSGKRRRVTDERELRTPLQFGWQRETRIHNVTGRLQGDVAYYAPCGKKIRQYPDVMKYLSRNGISDITRDNFSFSAKIRVGDFYEAREGPQGLQWSLLTEEEVIPRILAMEGRRGRPPNPEHQRTGDESPRSRRRKGRRPNVGEADFPGATDAKLLRKLEAQEMARQAAQIKMMRKLEQQAMARAAKEARKQQAIMAAEEKRKQKERVKILKQQEKIKRIQQIQMEKELRAQQILETKRKKTEEAANAKIMEAEKRNKEKEMRRQQAVILKHQELERHRLDMVWERERRRQHMMLMKTMDARKKAEERERLKQEKKDEKRLNKERKLELRRLELEIAKELKKPNEDMCLADHKLLPELSRIPGLFLPGSSFSDCLMVMQFLRSFGKVLGFDVNAHVPNLSVLQEGLLNLGDSMGQVQDLLVRMLSAVVCDPGLPAGHRTKTALGDHLANVGINQDNVSEALQLYMEAHRDETELQTELGEVTVSLKTKAFQAHTPTQKASVLAFLVNELSCSKSVVSEIDKNIDHMTNLRRDKWVIEGTLRKLRTIHAKKTGKRDSSMGGEETQSLGTPNPGRKRKTKGGDSEEDEDDDEDSEDQGDEDDDEEEEERGKKGKKVETCEEEDDGDQTASVEELEKQIDKLTKQQSQIRRKLFESSHSLRSMMFGQDRYKRRYWVLPQCGGIFVEGMETGKGAEELERERLRSTELVHMKEEVERRPEVEGKPGSTDGDMATPDKHSLNLFLQKPGSFSKLSKLLEVAKMSPDSDNHSQSSSPIKVPTTVPSPIHPTTQTTLPSSPCAAPSPLCPEVKAEPSTALFSPPYLSGNSSPGKMSSSSLQQQQLQPNDQLLRVLMEKSGHWFSLLPRSPCDESSTTTPPAFSPQSSTTRPKSPSSLSPNNPATTSASNPTTGINNFSLSALQQVKSGVHMMGLPFCGWPGGMMIPTLPFSASPLPPSMLSTAYHHVEGNGNPFLAASSLSSSKSKSPVPAGEKLPSAPPTVVEVAKTQDYPNPLPIPEEMLSGWWRVADMEELRSLVKALHSRGIREKALQKQIQKHMEYIAQACAKNRDVVVIDESELEENGVSEETVESWCVEEQAMEMDIAVLQQVEELERKVTSASLQVKSWMYAEPQSERGDLVYHEHKPIAKLLPAGEEQPAGDKERTSGNNSLVRHVNNPLDIAVTRLAELERNIERRYLKSPLSTTVQVKLDNVLGTVTVPAPAPSHNVDGEGGEEGLAPGMKVWRKAVGEVRSAAQLALCVQQLQKSIAWERSIMKVASGQSPENKKQQSRAGAAGGGKRGTEVKRSRKLSSVASAEVSEDDAASSSTPKKWSKEPKKRKSLGEESPATNQSKQDSTSPVCGKKAKTATSARDDDKDLNLCRVLLAELEVHQDAWPFLNPVNPKSVPGYKKVIRKPMDFSTIREKLVNSQYLNLETFIIDVNLVFDNCEKFNEDNSDIGRAGHNMRSFFQRRWTELLKQTN
ncbi:bromodomain adjacent to zinc finger domain protein 2B-like isoform X14 [Salvelinus fontinalis]|uniref:bromodomain adjacent to zinc finger domain protein 2B-like isoform X14 n=1 Tax=Salvelinus fontinalis TaxID=8038 RepID=UPI0024854BAD|nr:bromodomain adjacent to zinc finger domain protein 2B-like isoform X14 [Salvelinus fontinalis]